MAFRGYTAGEILHLLYDKVFRNGANKKQVVLVGLTGVVKSLGGANVLVSFSQLQF